MSTYDDASLILYPSGYKASNLYNLKPIPYLGSELVTNGSFATDTSWNKSSNWTISGGVAIADGTSSNDLNQGTLNAVIGTKYFISFDIISLSQGSFKAQMGTVGITGTAVGSFSGEVTATTTDRLRVIGQSSAIGSIDNVSVKEVIDDSDLTFTRASTATRVNAAGLIEGVRTNLALYSNDLSNAAWTKSSSTITSNAATSPDGTTNADKVVETANTALHRAGQGAIAVTSGQVYTFSFYAKAAERDELELQRINTSGTVFNSISVTTADLTLGTLSVGSNVTSSSINSVGDGWYRISLSLTAIATGSGGLNIGIQKNGNVFYLGDGISGVYVYGFQAEASPSATAYIPTTTVAVSVGMLANIPRIDYTGGGCAKLLLEPQRTNLALYSSEFDNAAWSKSSVSITANIITSPDGTTNADKMVESATTSGHYILQSPTLTAAAYTFTIFAKAGERNWFLFRQHTLGLNASFNLATGTLGTIAAGLTATIEDYGNDWYRCSVTFTGTAVAHNFRIYVTTADNSTSSYLGDGTSGLYLYGAGCELGSYPTSYIPTTSTSVTRVGDACSKTGISSLINSAEGVLYIETNTFENGGASKRISLSDGNANGYNRIALEFDESPSTLKVFMSSASNVSVSMTATGIDQSVNNKIALKYNATSVDLYVNGVLKQTAATSASTPIALSVLKFSEPGDTSFFYGKVQSLMIFPSALTDTELLALTTL